MRFLSTLFASALLAAPLVSAHLGIQPPNGVGGARIRDTLNQGDTWRYPNNGYCSGNSNFGGNIATLNAGQTYRFRMNDAPAAPHGGGHCSFFVTPDNGRTFIKIDDVGHCTCAPGQAGGTLNSGCAQNLNSGANQAFHDLTIPKKMPSVCGTTGCTLVWFWTPTFSAVCEIYSDCIDVKINGITAGSPSDVVMNGYPSRCSYPPQGGNGFTTNYGRIIGKSNANSGTDTDNNGNNNNNNGGGTTTGNKRCGSDWGNANDNCNTACNDGTDRNCPQGQRCYGDLKTLSCGGGSGGNNNPKPPTPNPNVPCRGAGAYASVPGIAQWCSANCAAGNCPPTVCQCTQSLLQPFVDKTDEYVPDLPLYSPTCRAVESKGVLTVADIARLFDNNDSTPGVSDETRFNNFVKEFIDLNKSKVSAATDVPKAGVTLLIPGDCYFTDQPAQLYDLTGVTPQSGDASSLSSSLVAVAAATFTAIVAGAF